MKRPGSVEAQPGREVLGRRTDSNSRLRVYEFQGLGNLRSAKQRAPTWNKPAGADALAALQAAFKPPRELRFAVICEKTTRPGVRVVFQIYESEDEAILVRDRLVALGCACFVEAR